MIGFYLALAEKESDKEKLELIYNKYKKKMWYAARSILHDDFLAEDAVHNAFIGIAKNMKSIKDADSPGTCAYVVTAAKNHALNLLRKSNPSDILDISAAFHLSDENAQRELEKAETEDYAYSVLMRLPETYRDVLYYLLVEGMSEKDIASLLSRNVNTVRQQVKRGRKLFIEQMEKGDALYE